MDVIVLEDFIDVQPIARQFLTANAPPSRVASHLDKIMCGISTSVRPAAYERLQE